MYCLRSNPDFFVADDSLFWLDQLGALDKTANKLQGALARCRSLFRLFTHLVSPASSQLLDPNLQSVLVRSRCILAAQDMAPQLPQTSLRGTQNRVLVAEIAGGLAARRVRRGSARRNGRFRGRIAPNELHGAQ